jgi:hypothetical protein
MLVKCINGYWPLIINKIYKVYKIEHFNNGFYIQINRITYWYDQQKFEIIDSKIAKILYG